MMKMEMELFSNSMSFTWFHNQCHNAFNSKTFDDENRNGIVFQFNVVHMVSQPMSSSFNSKTFDDENGNGIVFQFNVDHMVSQPMSA